MLPYWLLFAMWSAGAVGAERRRSGDHRGLFFIGAALATALMIGLRFQVGGDWGAYLQMHQSIFLLSLGDALTVTDPGYAALNWVAARNGLGMPFVNTVCAALFVGGFARLAWGQPNPALAMLVAVPYLIIVVAMGYTRQAAAIGLICFAVADGSDRRLARLVILIGIAALFHKTAILILPVALVPLFRRNLLLGAVGIVGFALLFVWVLQSSSDRLMTNYVAGNYDAQGAAIRTSMNVVAAVIFLAIRKRIPLSPFQQSFWLACALLSLASVLGLALSSASSGIDRLALYLTPLQAVVYGNLPYILSAGKKASAPLLLGLMAYSVSVQFVWLNYAANAYYWVPYRTVLTAEEEP